MARNWTTFIPMAITSILVMGGIRIQQRFTPAPPVIAREPFGFAQGRLRDRSNLVLKDEIASPPLSRGLAMTGERPPSILRRSDAMRRRIQEISGKIQMLEEKRLDLQGRLRASTWRGIHLEEQVGDLRDTIAQLKRQQAMLETLLLVAKRKEGREGEEGENRESREDRENRESRRHFEAGALFSETDRSEEAVSEYQQAVALAPSLTEAWENMGLEDLRLERYPQAHESFLRALSLNPGDASLHYNLAVLLDDRLNQPSQALLHYRLFLALAPEAPDAPEVRQRVRELEDAEDSWQ